MQTQEVQIAIPATIEDHVREAMGLSGIPEHLQTNKTSTPVERSHPDFTGSENLAHHVGLLYILREEKISAEKNACYVAFGYGLGLQVLKARGHTVTGIDINRYYATLARRRTGATIVKGDALQMPFGKETFDAAISRDFLDHCYLGTPINDTPFRTAAGEQHRILRHGGKMIHYSMFTDRPNQGCWRELQGAGTIRRFQPEYGERAGFSQMRRYSLRFDGGNTPKILYVDVLEK